ncbi:MAG: hypothetical protein DSM107014_16210 [Gomphosphaeria aponina SAG 52.96 = DSM 107014]|uniref:Uncharacterized protein n=1 Tax=Gomphosphaeria aponina SAG 52.96 = DSM 107014 TaxID=1521640 RepID=A0A941GTS3_9CHRO|nr:hypothetical protein [Gomphosphaeria aponina SAG 52.96 = DSM 107014]
MLAHYHRPICLSFISTDLPILSTIEAGATLYERDLEKFHVLLNQPEFPQSVAEMETTDEETQRVILTKRLLWLEISPYRAIMTMQGNGGLSYRHFWEQGIYGVSRYWLNNYNTQNSSSLRLRNFTRSLQLKGRPLPESLRVEYELWSDKVHLGHYILHLEIHH